MFLPLHLQIFSTTIISKVDDLNLIPALAMRHTNHHPFNLGIGK
jgi:hypothetical protein